MKLRSLEQLVDLLDEQSSRRKQELINVNASLRIAKKNAPQIMRSAVVFAYAHWEGFVKIAGQAYVALVAHDPPALERLAPCFQALACKSVLGAADDSKRRMRAYVELISLVTDQRQSIVRLDPSKCIDTESNLTAEVFENICVAIGLNYYPTWSTFGPFMDDLFRARCQIAHGELMTPSSEFATEAIRMVIGFIEAFKAEVYHAANAQTYLRTSA